MPNELTANGFKWRWLIVAIITVAVIMGSVVRSIYLYDKYSAMAEAEWAASGLYEKAHSAALNNLETYARQKISASVSLSTGTFILAPPLNFSSGQIQFLAERGYSSVFQPKKDVYGISVYLAEDKAMKIFAELHPELLLEEHLSKCSWGDCAIKMSYRPR